MIRRGLVLLLAASLAACGGGGLGGSRPPVSPPPPPPGPPPVDVRETVVALNIQPPADGAESDTVLSLLRAARVTRVRASWWSWSTVESWRWASAYRFAGIEILPIVYPASGAAHDGESIGDRYCILRTAVGAFPAVQLSNEVDGDGVYGIRGATAGEAFERGRAWGRQMRAAAEKVRACDPGAKIVTGGVAWVHPQTREFVRGMVEEGGFDVLAIHVYGIGCEGEPVGRWREVRAAGWTGPILVTEIGTDDAQATYIGRDPDEFQAEQIRRCLFEYAERGAVDAWYWFQLTPGGTFGLVREDWSPRPAFLRLIEEVAR